MIKCVALQFKELEGEDHWLAFSKFGECTGAGEWTGDDYRDCPINLSKDEVYQLSMDQSTTCTGIFIKNYRNTEVYMMEIKRGRGESNPTDYIYDLEQFLHQIFVDRNVSHIIYEHPIKGKSFKSSQALFQLEGMIKSLPKRYTEFSKPKLDCIENTSWRSAVVPSELKNQYDRKMSSKVAICNALGWPSVYGSTLGKDYDLYEAICIMFGWFLVAFDHLGRPYVRGPKTERTLGGIVLPGVSGEDAEAFLKKNNVETLFFVENPRYSIYQNLTAYVANYGTVCIEFTSPYTIMTLCVECNIKYTGQEYLTVILMNVSSPSKKVLGMAGGEFHFVI